MPFRYTFLAIDVSDEMLTMEALSMASLTHTDASFFLQLPWRVYERVRKEIERWKTKQDSLST